MPLPPVFGLPGHVRVGKSRPWIRIPDNASNDCREASGPSTNASKSKIKIKWKHIKNKINI